MIERSEAEEHLRVIRSLMEKATIYRAISAEAALFAGASAVVAAFLFEELSHSTFGFVSKWAAVLAACLLANGWFLSRDAKRRGEVFVSSGMRLALRTMFPPLLCGGVFTLAWMGGSDVTVFWLLFYGLALLSTAAFAPRSIAILGWAFVFSGLGTLLVCIAYGQLGPSLFADRLMGVTFGLFHLIYAACTWPRRAR